MMSAKILTTTPKCKTNNYWYEKQLSPKPDDLIEGDFSCHIKEEPAKVLEVLQKSRKGKIQYDTGWDTQPYGILKLISEVQAESTRFRDSNIARAAQIFAQSTAKEEHRKSLNSSSVSRSANSTKNLSFYYTANNTLASPGEADQTNATHSPSRLRTPNKPNRSPTSPRRKVIGIRDEENDYDEKADEKALATQSPIFAQFERCTMLYENERVASWLSKSLQKKEEMDIISRRAEAAKKELDERLRKEKEERRKSAALERKERSLRQERQIAEQRRSLDLQSELQEREFNRLREVEKEKLDILEEQRRKAEVEAAVLAEKLRVEEDAAKAEAERKEEEKARQNAEKLAEEQRLREQAAIEAAAAATSPAKADETEVPKEKPKSQGKVPLEFVGAVLETDLIKYLQLQQFLEEIKEKIAHISSTSPRTKAFYSAAMRVINTPLNSIANLSGTHLQARITHFSNLLDGKSVFANETMTTPFTSSSETNGHTFVLNLLAYRFVKKSEAEMTKGDKTAGLTPLAALGVHLARRYPEWSIVVRAYFYKMCPFLVPFNYPRRDMDVEQYAKAIGQDLSGNERAIQQVLLERIAGYCTLYVLMVDKFEQGGDVGSTNEFFTLNEVWRILATSLRLEPQLDVTATVLHTILETIGDKLAHTYRLQFRKYLQLLTNTYLSKISRITPPGKTAAITRLELFLESKAPTWFRTR